MNTLPVVTIGIITYNRLDQLLEVIAAYDKFVTYPRDHLRWLVSDDGSGNKYKDAILKRFPHLSIHYWTRKRQGMGANWNRMIFEAERMGAYTLCCQDDWLLTEPLDLSLAVAFMEAHPYYGMLRYHKLTGHVGLPMVMKEWDTREGGLAYQHGENEYVRHMLPYMELLYPFDNSDTYSPYSGGVHLRSKRFTQQYGEYLVGYDFSTTEMDFMRRVNSCLRSNLGACQRIAMFPHYIESRFKDIAPFTYRNTPIEAETIRDNG